MARSVQVRGGACQCCGGRCRNDTLTSIAANEIIYGNGGTNMFVFAGNFGKDIVADFQPATM